MVLNARLERATVRSRPYPLSPISYLLLTIGCGSAAPGSQLKRGLCLRSNTRVRSEADAYRLLSRCL